MTLLDWEQKAKDAGYHSRPFIAMFLGYLMAKVPELESIGPFRLMELFYQFEREHSGGVPADVAAIDRLKAQLWKYGKHLAACRLRLDPAFQCDCGWKDVRETLAPYVQFNESR